MKAYYPYKKEQSQIKGKFHPRRPKSRKEEAEFGLGNIDILVCKKCWAVYWYKNWHHRLEDYPELKQSKRLKFVTCPACQMIKDKKYEGEVVVQNVPTKLKKDIKALAKSFGEKAFQEDPLDRIISIKERIVRRPTNVRKRGAGSRKEFRGLRDIQILTTENQLAVRLAKKINETFKGKGKLSISHSHQEDVVRAKITF